ncbi:RHS repeat-associated core domain-containing protein [Kribbella sp.]|uniref:RHS repeat-associated core domain-containing protein n=1 Tax=Kribbella sp. TaxID=1871183 RepID=UPI002D40EC0B|nr:RHS repeat-associated core domain-containing protein [Kribbella sp.]HZX03864.1 RHS repeat-associated core domain-containing protein [Kribbella sp.]
MSGWNNYDEYGNATATSSTGPVEYGWLGAKQRAVSGAGLTLMGVRLYNPQTGLFATTDPVDGGKANAYTYPSDPINSFDLDGKRRFDDDDPKYTPKRLRARKRRNSLQGIAYATSHHWDEMRSWRPIRSSRSTIGSGGPAGSGGHGALRTGATTATSRRLLPHGSGWVLAAPPDASR